MSLDISYKSLVFSKLTVELQHKLTVIKENIESISAYKSQETKSVMGDKHETSRAMMQREEEKLKQRYIDLKNQQNQLKLLKKKDVHKTVMIGTLITTQMRSFLISIPFGKLKVGQEIIYCMSSEAPLAKAMMGKVKGESFLFNNQRMEILDLI